MDTGMRDLEQIQEQEYGQKGPSQLLVVILATVCGALLVLGLGKAIGSSDDKDDTKDIDPLAALADVRTGDPEVASRISLEKLERENLIFPEALAERPEVSAAIASASAELDALGEAHDGIAPPNAPAAKFVPQKNAAEHLFPAGIATGDDIAALAAVAEHDPMVNRAAVESAEAAATPAKTGQDGKYTLQVVSYRSQAEAENFAETLRARGHEAFVMRADIPGRGTFHRVRIGPFDNQGAAERYRRDFEATEAMNTFVVRRRN